MGVCPWSPLSSGLLTGKYKRNETGGAEGEGRLATVKKQHEPAVSTFHRSETSRIVDALLEVANEIGKSPAQVALNWVTKRPGVTSTILGATKVTQLEDNLAALEFDIPAELRSRLEEASRPELVFPYLFFQPGMQMGLSGGVPVRREPPWFRG